MDEKQVELETARIKSIIATARHEGANEAIKEVMDFMLNESHGALRIFAFMFDLNSRFSNEAFTNKSKHEALKGETNGR